MSSTHATSRPWGDPLADTPDLSLVMRRSVNGPEVKRVPVPRAFWKDLCSELWRDGCLRHGQPSVPLAEMAHRVIPEFPRGGQPASACNGFVIESTNPRGKVLRRRYTVETFADLATATAQQLLNEGVLTAQDRYYCELAVDQQPAVASAIADPEFTISDKPVALESLSVRLAPLLARAKSVGQVADGHAPVLYTEQAFAQAESFARRGAQLHPPRESGCVLVGFLCSCPDSGEFFLVVCDALQATDAEETPLSLTYTGKTWRRLQSIVAAMQRQRQTNALRILGQAHGHNFLPSSNPPCDQCPKVSDCNHTSVYVSIDDRIWSQAVFNGQPWVVCHIFGLNPRRQHVHRLYSLRDNRLVERGFHLLPHFNPKSDAC